MDTSFGYFEFFIFAGGVLGAFLILYVFHGYFYLLKLCFFPGDRPGDRIVAITCLLVSAILFSFIYMANNWVVTFALGSITLLVIPYFGFRRIKEIDWRYEIRRGRKK